MMRIPIILIILCCIVYSQECDLCSSDPSMCPPECMLPEQLIITCGDGTCDPLEISSCPADCRDTGITPECMEEWYCSEWTECINDEQVRNCTDKNNCATEMNKPATINSCGIANMLKNIPLFWIGIGLLLSVAALIAYKFIKKPKYYSPAPTQLTQESSSPPEQKPL